MADIPTQPPIIFYDDACEEWLRDIFENHMDEARTRVASLLEKATLDPETDCMITATKGRSKTCFRGRQTAAARFILCIHTQTVASLDEVARHRCHNPLCINPKHLELGSQADNRQDDHDRDAGGVPYWLL